MCRIMCRIMSTNNNYCSWINRRMIDGPESETRMFAQPVRPRPVQNICAKRNEQNIVVLIKLQKSIRTDKIYQISTWPGYIPDPTRPTAHPFHTQFKFGSNFSVFKLCLRSNSFNFTFPFVEFIGVCLDLGIIQFGQKLDEIRWPRSFHKVLF